MHRKHWNLDRKGREKRRKEPRLLGGLEAFSRKGQSLEVQSPTCPIYHDDAHKHQYASGQRKDQKLDRSVDAPWTSPHTDEEKHWNEHEFPKNKKEKKIRCGKQPDHGRLRDQQRGIKFPHSRLDRSPRGPDAEDAQK